MSPEPENGKEEELRAKAENVLRERKDVSAEDMEVGDLKKLVHSLSVHQIELEMQGDELRRSERDLEDAKQLYYQSYRFAPLPIFRLDRQGGILEMNMACQEILGLNPVPNPSDPRKIHSLTRSPLEWGRMEDFLEEVWEGAVPQVQEFFLNFEAGDTRFFRLVGIKQKNESIWLYALDVSEYKRAVAALEVERLRLGNILHGTNAGTWEWNIKTGKTIFNERWAEIIGMELADLGSTSVDTWMNYMHPDDLTQAQENLNKHFCGEAEFYQCEFRMRHASGHWVWVLDRGKVVRRDRKGYPEWMYGTHVDISSRKGAEEKMRGALDLLERTNELARVGTWEYLVDDEKLTWDRTTKIIHGVHSAYEPTVAIGVGYYVEEDRERVMGCFQASIAKKISFDQEFQIMNTQKERVWVRVIGLPVEEGDRVVRVYGWMQDISRAKEVQEAQREAQAAAEEANRAKSEFLANMSHEMRTPLNGIMGMIELLGQGPLNAQQSEYLTLLRDSSDSLLSVINDLLDIAKVETGKLEVHVRIIEVEAYLQNIVALHQREAKKKGLEFYVDIDPNVPSRIEVAADRLGQILRNILSNAVKFTSSGSVSVHLGIVESKDGLCGLEFRIKDTGIGIPEDKQDFVFEKFTQVDASLARNFEGSGLGLAICRELTNLVNGELLLESEVRKGSTFLLRVPVKHPESRKRLNQKNQEGIPTLVNTFAGMGARILLVEDNRVNQAVAMAILGKLGLEATAVNCGKDAISLLEKENRDVVLMDLQMPEMDGIETTRRIRSPASKVLNPEVPIVAMTAHSVDSYRGKCKEAGFTDFLAKPVSPKTLAVVISNCLGLRGPPDEDAVPENVLDLSSFKERLMGDQSVMRSVLRTFMEQLPENMELITSAWECGDSTVGRMLHTIKGSAANISADEFRDAVAYAEEHLEDPQAFENLKQAAERVQNHVHEILYTMNPKDENENINC